MMSEPFTHKFELSSLEVNSPFDGKRRANEVNALRTIEMKPR